MEEKYQEKFFNSSQTIRASITVTYSWALTSSCILITIERINDGKIFNHFFNLSTIPVTILVSLSCPFGQNSSKNKVLGEDRTGKTSRMG